MTDSLVVRSLGDANIVLDHADLGTKPSSVVAALSSQKRIIGALMLRDMKTRFGRSHVGYFIAILWPLLHMLGIMGVQYFAGRVTPIGTDLTIFSATGVLPYILCIYPARMMMMGIVSNQPLLLFSIVKTTDMIAARVVLETLTACVVLFVFMAILYTAGVDIQPLDSAEAVFAVLASILLGISMGCVNAVFFALFRMGWMVVFILITISLYASSGAFILSSNIPERIRDVLWFNPLFQCVEWLRSAYYDGYGHSSLSRTYVIGFSVVCLALGLIFEKLFRGQLYQQQ